MSYSVKTPFLFWFGASTLALALFGVISAWGNWLAVFMLCSLFGSLGTALLLMSVHVSADENGLAVRRPHKQATLNWDEFVAAEVGGGNLVLKTKGGRIVAPSFEFWVGKDKASLLALVAGQLRERQIIIRTTAGAAFTPDDR